MAHFNCMELLNSVFTIRYRLKNNKITHNGMRNDHKNNYKLK